MKWKGTIDRQATATAHGYPLSLVQAIVLQLWLSRSDSGIGRVGSTLGFPVFVHTFRTLRKTAHPEIDWGPFLDP